MENELNVMDMNLSSIEDLPGFDTPPSGIYLCSLSLAVKEIGKDDKKKPKMVFTFSLVETVEIGTQHTEFPAVPGQKFDILYNYDQEGLKYCKAYLQLLAEAVGDTSGSISAIVGSVQDVNVKATFDYSTSSKTKEDGTPYENFRLRKLEIL